MRVVSHIIMRITAGGTLLRMNAGIPIVSRPQTLAWDDRAGSLKVAKKKSFAFWDRTISLQSQIVAVATGVTVASSTDRSGSRR